MVANSTQANSTEKESRDTVKRAWTWNKLYECTEAVMATVAKTTAAKPSESTKIHTSKAFFIFFPRVRRTAKSDYVMSVRTHGTTRLPLDR
jgi:hypothetical protein